MHTTKQITNNMSKNAINKKGIRELIQEHCEKECSLIKFTDPPMILYSIRQLLEKTPTALPDGVIMESEKDVATPGGLMRISSESLSYIWTMRRGILYQKCCDKLITCPVNKALSEFNLFWKNVAAWNEFLRGTAIANMQESARRFVAVLLHVLPLLPESEEFLEVTWIWLQELVNTSVGTKPRLVTVGKKELIVALCQACLDRHVVMAEDIDESIKICGLRQVRLLLDTKSSMATYEATEKACDDLMTPEEAAKLIGLERATLNNKKSAGEIPKHCYVERPGRRIMYRRGELMRWQKGQQ